LAQPRIRLLVDGNTSNTELNFDPPTGNNGKITLGANGQHLTFDGTAGNLIWMNVAQANVDFRVSGDTVTDVLYVDASTDRVGVGTSAPTELFSVYHATANASASVTAATAATDAYFFVSGNGNTLQYVQLLSGNAGEAELRFQPSGGAPATIVHGATSGSNLEITGAAGFAVVFNEASADVDLRVEGNGDANLLVVDAGTDRVGIGVAAPGAKFEVNGAIRGQMDVEAATADPAPTAAESRKLFTNEGATGQVTMTLPSAAAGLDFTFVTQDVDGILVTAATGDTIRVAGSVSASGGTASSTTIGNALRLVAINATEWVAVSVIGTWTLT